MGYSSTRPATALPTRLCRMGRTVPTNVRGSAIVSARAEVTRTFGAGEAADLPALGAWALAAVTATRVIKSDIAALISISNCRFQISNRIPLAGNSLSRWFVEIGLDKAEQFLELSELRRSHPAGGAGANTFGSGYDLGPGGLRGCKRLDQLAATVGGVAAAANPAVTLHAVENANESGRFDPHSIGEVRLRQAAFQRQTAEDLGLPKSHALRSELFIEGPLQNL